MNYLAHILLSGPNVETTVGNFIGDGVKGKVPQHLSAAMQRGLKLHRFIDSYADQHPVNEEMRILLRPVFRKYAGVVLDMYHDHFLAMKWEKYGEGELKTYLDCEFASFEPFLHLFPTKSLKLYEGMKAGNWLLKYRTFDGLDRAFKGIAARTTFKSEMNRGVEVLHDHYDALGEGFDRYFPDIQREAEAFRRVLLKPM